MPPVGEGDTHIPLVMGDQCRSSFSIHLVFCHCIDLPLLLASGPRLVCPTGMSIVHAVKEKRLRLLDLQMDHLNRSCIYYNIVQII